MNIGDRVRIARKEKQLTQGQLAAKVGIRQPTLSDLENGESTSTTYLATIAAALGVSALWLETGKGPKVPEAAVNDESDELEKITQLMMLYRDATAGGRELILSTARNVAKRSSVAFIDAAADNS